MSRLWSRFAARGLSVALLVTGVSGGVYLAQDRQAQQRGIDASVANEAESVELRLMRERQAALVVESAQAKAAARDAAAKAAAAAAEAADRARRADEEVSRKKERTGAETGTGAPSRPIGPIPKSCGQYSGNKAIGCAVLLRSGFGLAQMPCLDKLWTRESHWRTKAENKSSGAFGIPQALPGSRMADVAGDWRINPETQIIWGLRYIKGRYDTPCGAWKHSQDTGWY